MNEACWQKKISLTIKLSLIYKEYQLHYTNRLIN